MMTSGDDVAFVVMTDAGEVRATIAAATLRTLGGRSHVTAGELLSIYRSELEDAVRRKIAGSSLKPIRLEARDL